MKQDGFHHIAEGISKHELAVLYGRIEYTHKPLDGKARGIEYRISNTVKSHYNERLCNEMT